jgi:hypothetical protein
VSVCLTHSKAQAQLWAMHLSSLRVAWRKSIKSDKKNAIHKIKFLSLRFRFKINNKELMKEERD